MRVLALALVLLGFAGAAAAQPSPASPLRFDPVEWFIGRTHNEGSVRPMMSASRRLAVEGVGRRLPNGALELRQVINVGAEQPFARTWRVTPSGANQWTLAGTDMARPGRAWREGDALVLEWTRINGDFNARQRLTLDPQGRMHNAMTLTRLGITLARIEEVIVREAPR